MSASIDNTNLLTNTAANVTTKNLNSVLKESFKVWKYTRHCHKKLFLKKINKTIWSKVPPFKVLNKLINSTKKLQELWVTIKAKKRNTPVPTTSAVAEHLENIILARDNWTRESDAIQGLESYISLSKTSLKIFKNLFSEKGALVKIDKTVYQAVAVRVLGKLFIGS